MTSSLITLHFKYSDRGLSKECRPRSDATDFFFFFFFSRNKETICIKCLCLFEIFFLLFQKLGFDITCKLSHEETICMKCQSLFSRKIRKNKFKLSSAEIFSQHAKH